MKESLAIQVGAASIDITPPSGTEMGGFAARLGPATGVHDSLLAQAIVVTDDVNASIVVVCDLVGLDIDDANEARARVGLAVGRAVDDVVVAVTHTHSGPAVIAGMAASGIVDPTYREAIFNAAASAARAAWMRRRPATLHTGSAELTSVAHNRRGGVIIDAKVLAARWIDTNGETIAIVFSHACHPVTLGPDNLRFTADWPGVARQSIQRHFGGEAIFVQGCCGQINTGHNAEASYDTGPSERRTFAESERIGSLVAGSVIKALARARRAERTTVSAVSRSVAIPLEGMPDKLILQAQHDQWEREFPTVGLGRQALLRLWMRWAKRWRDESRLSDDLTVSVAVHQWGEYRLVFLPGEPFVEFAFEIREALGEPDLLVIGYANGVPGYIALCDDDIVQGGYELDQSYRAYGLPAPFAATAGRLLFNTCRDLAGLQ